MYRKALAGAIKHFTGVPDPYQESENPDLVIESEQESIEASLSKILACIEGKFTVADGFAQNGAGRQTAYGRRGMVLG